MIMLSFQQVQVLVLSYNVEVLEGFESPEIMWRVFIDPPDRLIMLLKDVLHTCANLSWSGIGLQIHESVAEHLS